MTTASVTHWAALGLAVFFNVLSNLSLQRGVRSLPGRLEPGFLWSVVTQPWLWAGVTSAGLLLLCYLYAIRGLPLVVAYPTVTSLAMAGIAVASVLLFHSPLTPQHLAGIALVIAGVVLLVR